MQSLPGVGRPRLRPFRLANDGWGIVARALCPPSLSLLPPSLPRPRSCIVSDSYQKRALTIIGRKNDDEGAAAAPRRWHAHVSMRYTVPGFCY